MKAARRRPKINASIVIPDQVKDDGCDLASDPVLFGRYLRSAALLSMLCAALAPVSARAYSSIFVFGDSLSDTGNVFLASGGTFPIAPYFNGRASNGPIWVDDLSAALGLGPVIPSLAGGHGYAYGGATTGYAPTLSVGVPSLTQQVASFTGAGPASTTALYTVWIGANDLLTIVGSGGGIPGSAALGAAQTEADAINALAIDGAKHFLVPLVPDLGKTPKLAPGGGVIQAAGTALAQAYNAALEADLAGLAATAGIDVTFLDTFSLLDNAIANPSAFGFTNVTGTCYTGPNGGGGIACATPDKYLFWDQSHPTAAGESVIAQGALAAIPEPGAWALLAVGLFGLGLTRWHACPRRRVDQAPPALIRRIVRIPPAAPPAPAPETCRD